MAKIKYKKIVETCTGLGIFNIKIEAWKVTINNLKIKYWHIKNRCFYFFFLLKVVGNEKLGICVVTIR